MFGVGVVGEKFISFIKLFKNYFFTAIVKNPIQNIVNVYAYRHYYYEILY